MLFPDPGAGDHPDADPVLLQAGRNRGAGARKRYGMREVDVHGVFPPGWTGRGRQCGSGSEPSMRAGPHAQASPPDRSYLPQHGATSRRGRFAGHRRPGRALHRGGRSILTHEGSARSSRRAADYTRNSELPHNGHGFLASHLAGARRMADSNRGPDRPGGPPGVRGLEKRWPSASAPRRRGHAGGGFAGKIALGRIAPGLQGPLHDERAGLQRCPPPAPHATSVQASRPAVSAWPTLRRLPAMASPCSCRPKRITPGRSDPKGGDGSPGPLSGPRGPGTTDV